MLNGPATRRPRALKRAPGSVRRVAAAELGRGRIQAALSRCPEYERTVLALILIERLSPGEAAGALGVPVRELLRTYHALMAELRRAARGLRFRPVRSPASRSTATAEARLRRA